MDRDERTGVRISRVPRDFPGVGRGVSVALTYETETRGSRGVGVT